MAAVPARRQAGAADHHEDPGLLENALTLGSIRGVAIRIHTSWIFIALLVAWSFWSRFTTLHDYSVGAAILLAVVAAVLFFASVLVHELAHALEANHRDVEVSGITLFLFGGVTETRFDVERPVDEFMLTAVGPFSSFVLAGGFGIVAYYATRAGFRPVADVAGLMGWLNALLGLFNLLPGAPLDGGRILRSAVWKLTGDRGKAVRAASRSGQIFGGLLVALGLFQAFAVRGAFVGGLWLVFIGWFLYASAGSEITQHEVREKLSGVTVAELIRDGWPTVRPEQSAAEVAAELRRHPEDVLAVVRDGDVVGVVGVDEIAGVPADQRGSVTVEQLLRPSDDLPTVDPGDEVADVLDLARGPGPIIVRDGGFRALLTQQQLVRVLQRTQQLDRPPRPGRTPRRPRTHIPSS